MSNKLAKKYKVYKFDKRKMKWKPFNLNNTWKSEPSAFKTELFARDAIIGYIKKNYSEKMWSNVYALFDIRED